MKISKKMEHYLQLS